MPERDCYFCGQIQGHPHHDLIARLLPGQPYVRRVIVESASFAAIPSLGPVTDGHVLLCSKTHVRSFAALPPDWHSECVTMKRELRRELKVLYGGSILIFEHGMAECGDRLPCTVDHAHMHCLPLHGIAETDLIPALTWREFDGSLPALRRLSAGEEYLFLETDDGRCRLATNGAAGFESQLMRRVVAATTGGSRQWNWREAPNPLAAHDVWARFFARQDR